MTVVLANAEVVREATGEGLSHASVGHAQLKRVLVFEVKGNLHLLFLQLLLLFVVAAVAVGASMLLLLIARRCRLGVGARTVRVLLVHAADVNSVEHHIVLIPRDSRVPWLEVILVVSVAVLIRWIAAYRTAAASTQMRQQASPAKARLFALDEEDDGHAGAALSGEDAHRVEEHQRQRRLWHEVEVEQRGKHEVGSPGDEEGRRVRHDGVQDGVHFWVFLLQIGSTVSPIYANHEVQYARCGQEQHQIESEEDPERRGDVIARIRTPAQIRLVVISPKTIGGQR